jgi:hypothetical protein
VFGEPLKLRRGAGYKRGVRPEANMTTYAFAAPRTDAMIFKIFSPKNLAKKLTF